MRIASPIGVLVLLLSLAALGGLPCARDAGAQVAGPHLILTPYAGYARWGEHVNLEDRFTYGGCAGVMLSRYVGIEGRYGVASTDTHHGIPIYEPYVPGGLEGQPSVGYDATNYGGDVLLKLFPVARVTPFLLGGWQETKFETPTETRYENSPEAGAGLMLWLHRRVALRLEARDALWAFDSPPAESGDLNNNLHFTAGVQLAVGGRTQFRDHDQDGVSDGDDRCPGTPLGARVDLHGCPIDSDNDGVPDGIDVCADTPAGARVDPSGCPSDADRDGVADGIDRCPDTPRGVLVDANGCALDSDLDGVPDGLDECPNTPNGALVNRYGCPTDADADGIPDGLDECANTPFGAKVDKEGCPIEVNEKEVELLNTGAITTRNIRFETAKWDIAPGSYAAIDEIGGILAKWPDLRVEIGGHTDSRGNDGYNRDLSEKRAEAVRSYLLQKFPQIQASQYTAMGYGESRPVAANTTPEGMSLNRRVEFRVLNTDLLKKEHEKRRMLQKGE